MTRPAKELELEQLATLATAVLQEAQSIASARDLAGVVAALLRHLERRELESAFACSPTVAAAVTRVTRRPRTLGLRASAYALQRALEVAEGSEAGIARCITWRDRARAEVADQVRSGAPDVSGAFARLATAEHHLSQAFRRRRLTRGPETDSAGESYDSHTQ